MINVELIIAKVDGSSQNLGVDTFPDPVGHFGPLAANLDFEGLAGGA